MYLEAITYSPSGIQSPHTTSPFGHFQKSLPPGELLSPEDEPIEESKEAHSFCSNRLKPCWVTTRYY